MHVYVCTVHRESISFDLTFPFRMHDRKAFVLGMCSMMSLQAEDRPQTVTMLAPQFLPALIIIFNGLTESYDGEFR